MRIIIYVNVREHLLAWPFFTLNIIKRHYTFIKYFMQIECMDETRNDTVHIGSVKQIT